jgi:hypothetical protein
MLDTGLLGSIAVILGCLYAAARWAPVGSMHHNETVDRLYLPTFAAIAAGRVFAAALDDRTSLRSLRALLILRGGVEFWPGVAVGIAAVAIGLRRAGRPVLVDLVDLAPFALWGYGAWELTCWLRDGCFGPRFPIGLTPDGFSHPQLPIGLLMGAAIVALGFVIRHDWTLAAGRRLLGAIAGVAVVRALGSFWLPHLGDGLTRQHWQSIAIAAVASGGFAASGWWAAHARKIPEHNDDERDPDLATGPTRPSPPPEVIRPQRVYRSGPVRAPGPVEPDRPTEDP